MSFLTLAISAGVLLAVDPSPQVDRGARIAYLRCAASHATTAGGQSPNLAAPPFQDIRMRYNALSLERELAGISEHGHFEMRAQAIGPSDAEDLAAYIEAIGPRAR